MRLIYMRQMYRVYQMHWMGASSTLGMSSTSNVLVMSDGLDVLDMLGALNVLDMAIKAIDTEFIADKANNDMDIDFNIGIFMDKAIIKMDAEPHLDRLSGANISIKK